MTISRGRGGSMADAMGRDGAMAPGSQSFDEIHRDLDDLKQSLIYMDAADITVDETRAFADQISVIRLQLKRLLEEQRALGLEIERRAFGR